MQHARRSLSTERVSVFVLASVVMLAGCELMPSSGTAPAPATVTKDQPTAQTATPAVKRAPQAVELELLQKQPTDVVSRIRENFSLPQSTDPAIDQQVAWFASHQEYIDRVFARATPYLFHIADELEQRGMPSDLALLPIVESGFDPFAYSPGRASGLWQIIPGTGRHLGLKQNWWFDGRRDVIESTRAALDYLEALHERFNGDWLLAIAGYNSGEGNVARAIRRTEAAGNTIDFWTIRQHLPAETRAYVSRLLAIRDIVAAAQANGITLPTIKNEPFFATVNVAAQIDMALAARLSELELDELYRLNPGINRWATDPEGPHRLLVPIDRAEGLRSALAQLGDREHVQWTRHRIQTGETLSHIALEYGTTNDVLRQVNDLESHIIRAGSYLLIPHSTAELGSYGQSLDARTERQQNRPRDGQRQVHVVRSGDSLWSVSNQFQVSLRQLASWNAMAPGDVLNVGKRLVVWTNTTGISNSTSSSLSQGQIRRINYTVRRGDSLSSIAARFRVTVSKLLEWNSLSPNKYLQPGQRLLMYVDVTEQST